MKKSNNVFVLLMALMALTGCATKMSDVTDKSAPTMKQIHDGYFNEVNPELKNDIKHSLERKKKEGVIDLRGYTRTANNEHQILFKRIENPILVGYVFAHLTSDSIPIPSYSISFRMSPRDYYAMPGEDQSF